MPTLLILSLAAIIVLTMLRSLAPRQPQPPQIIYVQTVPQDTTTSAGGCLPLIVLLALILLAIGVV